MARSTPDTPFRRFTRGFDRLALRSAAFLAVLGAAACVTTGSGHWLMGNHLDHERQISFDPELDSGVELVIEMGAGDVEIVSVVGPSRLTATVHEEVPGSADLHFEGGRLVLSTVGGDEAMIAELMLELSHGLESITVNMGAGELTVDGIDVRREVAISNGAGSVRLERLGAPRRVEIGQGAGDLRVRGFEAEEVLLDLGAGDTSVDEMWIDRLEVNAGVGSIRVSDSTVDSLQADAGIGEIDLRSSDIRSHSVDAGIGSVNLDE